MSGRDEKGIRYEAQRSLSVSLLCAFTITSGAILVRCRYRSLRERSGGRRGCRIRYDGGRLSVCNHGVWQPAKALLWDAIWTLISILVFAASWLDNSFMTAELVILLLGRIRLAVLCRLRVTDRRWPQLGGIRKWLVRDLGARVRFGLEASVGAGSVLIVSTIAAALVGPEATAALRGAGQL